MDDVDESIVLVLLSMPSIPKSRMEARLPCAVAWPAMGVKGLVGESCGGGGSGKGFSRLLCRLKLRACCACAGVEDLEGRGPRSWLSRMGGRLPRKDVGGRAGKAGG